MCFGTARIIDDLAEKARALDRMIDRFYPDRAATLRQGTDQDLKATMLIGMAINDASDKIRAKGVCDEEEDYALAVYAARLPARTVIGEIEPCSRLLADVTRPDGLAGFTPGRTPDDVMLENYRTPYGEPRS